MLRTANLTAGKGAVDVLRAWRTNGRLWLIQSAILTVFFCVPLWTRLPEYLPIFPSLYVTRFVIFILMSVVIGLWLVFGLPGLRSFARERWRALWAIALIALAIWGFASTSWAFVGNLYPEVGETAALQFGVVVLFVVAVGCVGPPPRAIVAALVTGLIGSSLITFGQAAKQAALGLTFLGELPYSDWTSGMSFVRAGDLEYLRPYGLMPHPNMLGGILVVGLLAAAAWILSEQRWQRYAGMIIFATGLYALLLTFSRTAWGALAVGLVVALVLVRRHLRRPEVPRTLALALGLALVAGVVFFVTYRPLLAARVGEGQESIEQRSISDRIVFTEFALESIGERPLMGVGIGNFPWRTSYFLVDTFYDMRGDNVHNIYLSAWAEMGIVGLALYLAAMGFGVVGGIKTLSRKGEEEVVSLPAPQRIPLIWFICVLLLLGLLVVLIAAENAGLVLLVMIALVISPSFTIWAYTSTNEDQILRIALLAVFVALAAAGLLDHYPYTAIQFQVAMWGCLAAVLRPGSTTLP